jgi:CubicO group peptidase (beta-lactamase class C family)
MPLGSFKTDDRWTIMTLGTWKRWRMSLAALAVLTLGVLFLWPKAPQPPSSVTNVAHLEAYLGALVDFGIPPGMSLVVVKNGKTVYSHGFGWADQP